MTGIKLQIRPDDCDVFGHINNCVYLEYMQYAFAQTLIQMGFAQDWMDDSDVLWQMKTITVEYRQAAVFGDVLHASLWLEHADPTHPQFGCEIIKSDFSGQHNVQTIARTLAEWQRVSKTTGDSAPLPPSILTYFPQSKGSVPRPFELPGDDGDVRQYIWEHRVMRAEIGSGNHVRPRAIYNWLEEAVFEATSEGGWPPEKRRDAGVFIFQMRHDTDIFHYPQVGDAVQVISRLLKTRKFQGTWLQEVILTSQHTLCALDYSTGIFVDLHGHPSSPPPQMIQDIQGN